MSDQQKPTSNAHAFIQWVGVAGVCSLLMLALMMGRYAQRVDEIAEDVEVIRVTSLDNAKQLAEVAKVQAIQGEADKMIESRIDRLETAKNAR